MYAIDIPPLAITTQTFYLLFHESHVLYALAFSNTNLYRVYDETSKQTRERQRVSHVFEKYVVFISSITF